MVIDMIARNRGWIINCCDLTEKLVDALADAGINELGIHPGGGADAGRLLEETLLFHDRPETQALYRRAAEKGITVEYDIHALSRLLPREEFARHPEWFRMDENGCRAADNNMCPSCEEALRLVSENSEKLARALRTNTHRYAYWTDDIDNKQCRCEKCGNLSPADQTLIITNAILRGLRRADPQAIIGYLAYQDTLSVPEHVLPDEGVYLEYAPIRRNSSRPIDDPDCPENAEQTAPLEALLRFFGTKNARVLEYWVDNSRFSQWKRPPRRMDFNAEVMRRDVAYYKSMGFEDMTSFACFLGEDYIELYGEPPIAEYAAVLKGN